VKIWCSLATATTKRVAEAAELCCVPLLLSSRLYCLQCRCNARSLRSENIRAKEEADLAVNCSLCRGEKKEDGRAGLHCLVGAPGGPSRPRPTKNPSRRPRESPSGPRYDGTNMKISRCEPAPQGPWDSGSGSGALFLCLGIGEMSIPAVTPRSFCLETRLLPARASAEMHPFE
jgi:hypothetical protein